ncbi:MAG: hypothetical protein AAB250_18885, partial [Bdellovibrionota bacterium]
NLRSELAIGERLAIPNLQYKGGTVSKLSIKRISATHYELEVTSQRPFTLEIGTLVDASGVSKPTVQRRAESVAVVGASQPQRFVLTLVP